MENIKLFEEDIYEFIGEHRNFKIVLLDRNNNSLDTYFRDLIAFVIHPDCDINNLVKLDKSHLYLNPLPLIRPYQYKFNDIPWKYIGNISLNCKFIETWSFKGVQGPFNIDHVVFNNPWFISASDFKQYWDLDYSDKWLNLEFINMYYIYGIKFRIAIEYCRLEYIDVASVIKNYHNLIQSDYIYRMIHNHVKYVDIYQTIPDNLKGQYIV